MSAFHELECWTVYRESELAQGSSLCSSFFPHDFLTVMDCTLTLWANKNLSFPQIAAILCFVLTRKVAKTAMDQKGTSVYVIYLQGVHEPLWKYVHEKELKTQATECQQVLETLVSYTLGHEPHGVP